MTEEFFIRWFYFFPNSKQDVKDKLYDVLLKNKHALWHKDFVVLCQKLLDGTDAEVQDYTRKLRQVTVDSFFPEVQEGNIEPLSSLEMNGVIYYDIPNKRALNTCFAVMKGITLPPDNCIGVPSCAMDNCLIETIYRPGKDILAWVDEERWMILTNSRQFKSIISMFNMAQDTKDIMVYSPLNRSFHLLNDLMQPSLPLP